jgi:hypothetical protein
MSLGPGLLWLTLNLALTIQCLSWNDIHIIHFFNFTNPLRCLRVPPGVRVPHVEYHCRIQLPLTPILSQVNPDNSPTRATCRAHPILLYRPKYLKKSTNYKILHYGIWKKLHNDSFQSQGLLRVIIWKARLSWTCGKRRGLQLANPVTHNLK